MYAENKKLGRLNASANHCCEISAIATNLAEIHTELSSILGKNCIMHGIWNTSDPSSADLGKLGHCDSDFFHNLFNQFPAKGDSPRLNALINYQTRSRVMQVHFLFDHTLNHADIHITFPASRLPRKQIVGIASTLIESLHPSTLTYFNHELLDALTQRLPAPPQTHLDLPSGNRVQIDHAPQCNAHWITYKSGLSSSALTPQSTIEVSPAIQGQLLIAKSEYFHTINEVLLMDLVRLHHQINEAANSP